MPIRDDNEKVLRWTWGMFLAEAKENVSRDGDKGWWTGGVNYQEAVKRATFGDLALAGKAGNFLEKLKINSADNVAFQTICGVAGGAVNVGAFLTNHPDCMFSRQRVQRQNRSVNIYVNINSSGGVSSQALLERGTLILGLLEALQAQQVTVDLYLVGCLGNMGFGKYEYQLIELPSRPLDLATLGFAIAHPAFDRHLLHTAMCQVGWSGQWAGDTSEATIRRKLGMQPQDVYIPETYSGSEWRDPQRWLDSKISQLIK